MVQEKARNENAEAERHHVLSLTVGQYVGQNDRYRLVHQDGEIAPAGEPPKALGGGGAGIVYRATDSLELEFAIKFLNPTRDRVKGDSGPFHKTFNEEIRLLATLTHTRLSKITDAGSVADVEGKRVPFYVMQYIEGKPVDKLFADGNLSADDFLELIDQILDGLEYLHDEGVLHCDLKSENVFVRWSQGRLHATILDLGVAKIVDPLGRGVPEGAAPSASTSAQNLESADTLFFSTKRITRPEWHELLTGPISRETLRDKLFPSHDLFGVGVLIDEGLAVPAINERLNERLGERGFAALATIRDRLKRPSGAEHYNWVSDLRRDWRKLDPRYLAPVGIPELAIGAQAETSIATPTGRVSLTGRCLAIVNHPLMQRLHLIPQLELASLVYPGATHTRLLHSLSTFDMARRFVTNLLRDPTFRLIVERAEIEALLLSCLCHDVGHYPLSHMFEDLAQEEQQTGGSRAVPFDEELFDAFIDPEQLRDGPFSEMPAAIDAGLRSGLTTTQSALHDEVFGPKGFSEDVLIALRRLKTPTTPSERLLLAVMDSPVDVDKIAYLADDSLMTGVRYGLGTDLDALFGALRAPSSADLDDARWAKRQILALNDKGLPAAEAVILARYWMLKRVYWHHTNRAMIAMVKFVLAKLRSLGQLDMPEYIEATLFSTPQDALRLLHSRFEATGVGGTNPINGLLDGNRGIYKRVLTVAKGDPNTRIQRLYEALAGKRLDELDPVIGIVERVLASRLGRDLASGEVVIDVPVKKREFSEAPILVYLRGDPDRGRDIAEVSPVIAGYRSEFDQHLRKCRVFVHPAVRTELGDRFAAVPGELETALADHFGVQQ